MWGRVEKERVGYLGLRDREGVGVDSKYEEMGIFIVYRGYSYFLLGMLGRGGLR